MCDHQTLQSIQRKACQCVYLSCSVPSTLCLSLSFSEIVLINLSIKRRLQQHSAEFEPATSQRKPFAVTTGQWFYSIGFLSPTIMF